MTEHRETYDGYRLEWFVNVGLPTANALDRGLSAAYARIVHAAWGLSVREEPVTLELAEEALKRVGEHLQGRRSGSDWEFLHPEAVDSFPEFVAQVASYVRSPVKAEDLHVLVDIGAGTLDATVFNVMDIEGQYRYPIMARTVRPLGTEFLIRYRIKRGKNSERVKMSPQDPVPKAQEMSEKIGVSVSELREIDQGFATKVRNSIGEPLRYTKRTRYPTSRKWKEGVPVFVCGGGAKCDFYQETLERYFEGVPWSSLVRTLPRPEGLHAPELEDEEFDRLAVAYGLSINALDIGELVRPEDIDDVPMQGSAEAWRDKFVDKDQV